MRRRALLAAVNALSLSRIALAAAYPLAGDASWRVSLVALAGASDFLDGWIARRTHLTTRWGAILDPVTDRLFVLTAITTHLVEGSLGVAQYYALLVRDLATAVGFLVARAVPWLRGVELRARWAGKIVTVLQLATLLALSLAPRLVVPLVAAVVATSVWAIADYTRALWRERPPA
ncbi:MAG TPA: CDP-alcohol phosphatidyltransferase family protein [Gemmatimonadaceae bacterium]